MLLTPMQPMLPISQLDHVNSTLSLQHPSLPSQFHMPPTKRPKLSLQTSHLSTTYGTVSSQTGGRPGSMSAATPTTYNTLSNAFDLTFRPSPSSATTSPAPFPRAKSACSSPYPRNQPYDLNLPLGKRPILKNSSLVSEYGRASLTTSASPRTSRRVFFPPPKKVTFQTIDEEIVTHTYVARHVDLTSSEDESSEADEVHQIGAEDKTPEEIKVEEADDREGRKRGRSVRGHSTSAHRGRRKKRRWEWTLGELEKEEAETLSSSSSGNKGAFENMEDGEAPSTNANSPSPTVETVTGSAAAQEECEMLQHEQLEFVPSPLEGNGKADSDWETCTSSACSTPATAIEQSASPNTEIPPKDQEDGPHASESCP